MLIYGGVAFRLPAIQMRPDRLGDNFYYLGFIYTLASLSAALLQLRSGTQIDELLGNFWHCLDHDHRRCVAGTRFSLCRCEENATTLKPTSRRDLASASADLRAQLVLFAA